MGNEKQIWELRTGFSNSSGHRQLLWPTSGETGPGLNISKCWKAAGTHGGSFICANSPSCWEHHGSICPGQFQSRPSFLRPQNTKKQLEETLQFWLQINCFCYSKDSVQGPFIFRLRLGFLHPQASWVGLILSVPNRVDCNVKSLQNHTDPLKVWESSCTQLSAELERFSFSRAAQSYQPLLTADSEKADETYRGEKKAAVRARHVFGFEDFRSC